MNEVDCTDIAIRDAMTDDAGISVFNYLAVGTNELFNL
jgi:hypothetical protein